MGEELTIRHVRCGHSFQVSGLEALPPSARETSDPRVYELGDAVDCPICTPPEQLPDW